MPYPKDIYLLPQKDEDFESSRNCFRRLQGYALSQGFAVVPKSGRMKQKSPLLHLKCMHHGKEMRNDRQLELHIERDVVTEKCITKIGAISFQLSVA